MIPNIQQKDIFWETTIKLDVWSKFFDKDLNIVLNVGGDCVIDEVTKIHEQGYNYLISHQQEILIIVLDKIYENYSIWQSEYGYTEDEKKLLMPDIMNTSDLKSLIYPEKIFIMDIEVKQQPYLGIQFNSKWDEEHGLGIMLYRNRVIKVGGSDTAFMSWIAEEDKENIQ